MNYAAQLKCDAIACLKSVLYMLRCLQTWKYSEVYTGRHESEISNNFVEKI